MKTSVKYLLVISLAVLTAALAGCGISQQQYDEVQSQLAQAQADRDATRSQLTAVQQQLDNIKTQLTSAQQDYNSVKSQLDSAQSEIAVLQQESAGKSDVITQNEKDMSELQTQLDAILDTPLTQYYRVTYQNRDYAWDLPVTLRSYFNFKDMKRPKDITTMVLENDPSLDALVGFIENSSLINNLKKSEEVNLVARLVQSLPRINQDVRTPYDNYPRYPVETLVDQAGDSQDTAILTAALLYKMEYDVVFFYYEEPLHLAVGVYMPGVGGYYWEKAGKRYYYLETTGEAWLLGDCPPPYRTNPVIYTIGE
jgi:hypothetical protein